MTFTPFAPFAPLAPFARSAPPAREGALNAAPRLDIARGACEMRRRRLSEGEPLMHGLDGKVILVTGGTSGLGAATARLLAARGARVALTGRRRAQGEAVVAEIGAAGGEALFVEADVTKAADCAAMVARTLERFGRLDGAFNNAGISGRPGTPAARIEEELWNAVIATNLTGVWLSMKHEIPALLAAGGGAIVNNSSIYGLMGSDVGHAAYAAAKFGVIGLTKTAANDYGRRGIRVNAVCPGFCHSEMVDPQVEARPDTFAQVIRRHSAMNRLGEANEVAEAVAWLLSDASSFVSGVALPVQGGDAVPIGMEA
jgi:NAD(P)-dependent dehydrogenase (short-subunit alcohol dehydrogenase family)